MEVQSDFLHTAVIYLGMAVIAVPLFKRLGLGAVLGYMVAGILIGPQGFDIVHEVDPTLHFSELGVVLLMFLIGLELNPAKLWQLRKPIFGLGTAQVALSILVLVVAGFNSHPNTAMHDKFRTIRHQINIFEQSVRDVGT